jgi:hypothetical protein
MFVMQCIYRYNFIYTATTTNHDSLPQTKSTSELFFVLQQVNLCDIQGASLVSQAARSPNCTSQTSEKRTFREIIVGVLWHCLHVLIGMLIYICNLPFRPSSKVASQGPYDSFQRFQIGVCKHQIIHTY